MKGRCVAGFALTTYGRREWIACSALALAILAAIFCLAGTVAPLIALAATPVLIVWGWVLWFFRDPERPAPSDPAALISSADGVVADITPVGPDELLGKPGLRIGVFMSIFNVHVNRVPFDAEVLSTEHTPGAFLDARHPEAAFRNESATTKLAVAHNGKNHTIAVRQVAGLIARRIVTDVHPGQKTCRGQRMGMIKFGSRVELWVPDELVGEVCVQVGDRSVAGQTVLVTAPAETRDNQAESPRQETDLAATVE